MSNIQNAAEPAALKRALLAIKDLRAKLETLERARREPIAIVGIGCRFPGGVVDADSFWHLLRNGVDAVGPVPRERWDADALYDEDPDAPGKTYSRHGGFLDAVDRFDAAFFGISPREAVGIDPQQRLLLEVAWEALENTGQDFTRLSGSDTGVFIGISTNEYGQMQTRAGGTGSFDAYSGTGNTNSVAAGRISYVLGLHGPTMSVDTACSSSLVVVQLACQALRDRKCRMVLAGGVNLTLSPDATICMSKVRALSVRGRCCTFDASADGYVRGEGCGVIVLKRLSDAVADRDNILAVIRGAAVNHDGHSGGLTVPNGMAQQAVIRAALEDGGVDPLDVSYVEAHGTGTALGDPIEVRALAAVLCEGRGADRTLALGSVKTNLGHLESAAGISGLIKVVLALTHRELPPHLHLRTLSPHVEWQSMPMTIPTELSPWNPPGGRRIASINSFGLSGTNAHVIVEEAPVRAVAESPALRAPAHLLTLSGKSAGAVQAMAARLEAYLARTPEPFADVCFTANAGRAQFAHRAAIVAGDAEEARARLRAIAAAENPASAGVREWSGLTRPKLAFLFTGQGSQYVGMGRALYQTQPVFRAALDRCSAILSPIFGRDLLGVLFGRDADADTLLNQTGWTQPALFAIEYALAELWRSWGVEPSAVLGHSVGEYAAACVAGVFSLEDGLTLIAARARLMQALPTGGKMTAVFADEEAVRRAVVGRADVSIAAINGPSNIVISGAGTGVDVVATALARGGVGSKPLNVSHAFHSSLMDPMLDEFEAAARRVQYNTPRAALVSNVTGRTVDLFDAAYWRRHIAEPVQFVAGVRALRDRGCAIFIEVGPAPVLVTLAGGCVGDHPVVSLPSLRPGRNDWQQMLESAAELYVNGVALDWTGLEAGSPRRKVALPTYPFERQRFWFDVSNGAPAASVVAPAGSVHPFLGARFQSPIIEQVIFQTEMTPASVPAVRDHVVHGMCVFPAAAYLEAMQAAIRLSTDEAFDLADVTIDEPLILADDRPRRVQTIVLLPSAGTAGRVQIVSAERGTDAATWVTHVSAAIVARADVAMGSADLASIRARCREPEDVSHLYQELHARGLEYGPGYRTAREIWKGDGEALGRLELGDTESGHAAGFTVHPALLDGALQVMGGAVRGGDQSMFLPVGVDRVIHVSPAAASGWSHVQLRSGDALVADITLLNDCGDVVARLDGFTAKRVDPAVLARLGAARLDEWFYRVDWREASSAHAGEDTIPQWIIFTRDAAAVAPLVARLGTAGVCNVVVAAQDYAAPLNGMARVRTDSADDVRRVFRDAISSALPCGVIFACHPFASMPAGAGDVPDASAAEWLLHVVQAVTALENAGQCRLWVVTRGAQDVLGSIGADAVAQAPLLGLARVAENEHPEIRCVRVDLDPHGTSFDWDLLVDELRASDEPEFAFRTGRRWVRRLMPATAGARDALSLPSAAPFRIGVTSRGVIDNITSLPMERKAPGEGEVEIEIGATGLNFRDVLNVLGMYPGDPGPLGGECAGRVVRVGPGVTAFAEGDDVLGIAGGTFASHVVTRADMVVRRPSWMTVAEAASLPIAYVTAYYGLHHLARIKAGDRVLVHAAAGGVGIAAVQLAQRAGAEVFGTAGSSEKRKFVQSLGVRHVFRSRTADFRPDLMEATSGAGVDIILNALTGAFIPESLASIAAGGTFLEIGKAEIWSAERVAAVNPNVRYVPYDLVDVVTHQPALIGEILRELLNAFEDGGLSLMPLRTFELTEARAAFRYMAQARHIGKIVLVRGSRSAAHDVVAGGAYLVTGGLGALGLRVGRLLAERGAGSVYLVGRSEPSAEIEAQVEAIRQDGTTVRTLRADIAVEDDVRRVFAEIDAAGLPLCGIVHAAGIVDDGVLSEQTGERLRRVLAPKANGAALLDRFSRGRDLDAFVLFSSIASVFGAPAQGPYAAANAVLDSLAARRRALGRAALSLNWGPWEEAGMAARLGAAQRERVAEQGFGMIPTERGLSALRRAMSLSHAQLAVAAVDWGRVLGGDRDASQPALLRDLAPLVKGRARRREAAATVIRLADRLKGTPPSEWTDEIVRFTRQQVAKVLALASSDGVGEHVPLTDLGMDSLMAVELRNALAAAVGQTLPASLVYDHPTVGALATYVHGLLAPAASPVLEPARPAMIAVPEPVELGEMSQDEIALLLAERLATLKDRS